MTSVETRVRPAPARAALRLTVAPRDGAYEVSVHPAEGPAWISPNLTDLNELAKGRTEADAHLTAMKRELALACRSPRGPGSVVRDWTDVGTVLTALYLRAHKLLDRLLAQAPRTALPEFVDSLDGALQRAEVSRATPFVEFDTSVGAFIPAELLPCRNGNLPLIDSAATLADAARYFLGFRAIVRTTLSGQTVAEPPPRRPDDAVDAAFWWNAHLKGVKLERDRLVRFPTLRLKTSRPLVDDDEAKVLKAFVDDLAGGVPDPPEPAPTVVHVACHCKTDASDANHTELVFRSHSGATSTRIVITAERLREALLSRSDELLSSGRNPSALVFANACGATRLTVAGVGELSRLLTARAGVSTVIGALVNIPDAMASTFSPYVYRHLLSNGTGAATALHRARVEYLHDRRNPIGLAYSAFGWPETTLSDLEPPPTT